MITTLYLMRHGETVGDGKKRYHGSIDVSLSENGIRQVAEKIPFINKQLAASAVSRRSSYLKDVHNLSDSENGRDSSKIHAVYCSDLGRSAKSAEIIAESYGLTPLKVSSLRERNFGIWEGMSFIEIKEKYAEEFNAWAENPLKYSPIGGETTLEVKDRVISALDQILINHKGENILVVAHGGINRIVLCHILGIPLENIFRIEQDYATLNIIEFWNKYPVLKLLNG